MYSYPPPDTLRSWPFALVLDAAMLLGLGKADDDIRPIWTAADLSNATFETGGAAGVEQKVIENWRGGETGPSWENWNFLSKPLLAGEEFSLQWKELFEEKIQQDEAIEQTGKARIQLRKDQIKAVKERAKTSWRSYVNELSNTQIIGGSNLDSEYGQISLPDTIAPLPGLNSPLSDTSLSEKTIPIEPLRPQSMAVADAIRNWQVHLDCGDFDSAQKELASAQVTLGDRAKLELQRSRDLAIIETAKAETILDEVSEVLSVMRSMEAKRRRPSTYVRQYARERLEFAWKEARKALAFVSTTDFELVDRLTAVLTALVDEEVTLARNFDDAVQKIQKIQQIRLIPTELACARLLSKAKTLRQLKGAVELVSSLEIELNALMFSGAISNLYHDEAKLHDAIEILREVEIELTDDLFVRAYQRARTVGDMLNALEASIGCGFSPSPVTASKAIFLAGKSGPRNSPNSFNLALRMYNFFRNIGVDQTSQILDALMAAAGTFDDCRDVLRFSVEDRVALESITYKRMTYRASNVLEAIEALVWAHANTGELDCDFLHYLQNGPSMPFGGIDYELLFIIIGIDLDEPALSKLIRNSFHKLKGHEVLLLRQCIDFKPTNEIFVPALRSVTGLEDVLQILELMVDFGVSPNERTVSKMITRLQRPSEVPEFIKKLTELGIDAVRINFGSMVEFFPDAKSALEEMSDYQVRYDLVCDRYTLNRLIHFAEDFQVGIRILRRFKSKSITSDIALLHLITMADTFDDALIVLEECQFSGLLPPSKFGYHFFGKVRDSGDVSKGIDYFERAGGRIDLSAFHGIVRGLEALIDKLEYVDGFSRFKVEINEHLFDNICFKVQTLDDCLVLKSWLERRGFSMTAAHWQKIIIHCLNFEESQAMLETVALEFPVGNPIFNVVANKAESVAQLLSISEFAQKSGSALSKKSLGRCAFIMDGFSDALALLEHHISYDIPVSVALLNKCTDVSEEFSEIQVIVRLISDQNWPVSAWLLQKFARFAETQDELNCVLDLVKRRSVPWQPASIRDAKIDSATNVGVWPPKLKRLLVDEEKNATDALRKLKGIVSDGAPIRRRGFNYLYGIASDFESAFDVLQFQADLGFLPSNFEFGRIVRLTKNKSQRVKLLRKLLETNRSSNPGMSLEEVLYLEGLLFRAANKYERTWIKTMGSEKDYSIDRDMALWGRHLARRGNPAHSGSGRHQRPGRPKFLGRSAKNAGVRSVSSLAGAIEKKETPASQGSIREHRVSPEEAQLTVTKGQPKEAEIEFAKRLGHAFSDVDLLVEALTHVSASSSSSYNNQRLSSIGNNFLRLTLSEALFAGDPKADVGLLAPRLSYLVCEETRSEIAQTVKLGSVVRLGRPEIKSGGRKKLAILATALDALLGAIYLDVGAETSRGIILRLWASHLDKVDDDARDPKTKLQERVAELGKRSPKYSLVSREGPDHAPVFVVEVRLEDGRSARAQATRKREAEKKAARALLDKL